MKKKKKKKNGQHFVRRKCTIRCRKSTGITDITQYNFTRERMYIYLYPQLDDTLLDGNVREIEIFAVPVLMGTGEQTLLSREHRGLYPVSRDFTQDLYHAR